MRTRFTEQALLGGSIMAHCVSNLVVVLFFWFTFSLFNHRSLKLFGCLLIYFIIAYELVFNCVKNISVLMELN